MRILILFTFLPLHLLLNLALKSNLLSNSLEHGRVVESICKCVNEDAISRTDTNDILIANLGDKMWSTTVNDLAKCVESKSVVVLSNLNEVLRGQNLRKASMTIVTFYAVDQVNMLFLVLSSV